MYIYVKIHHSGDTAVLAACDENVLGEVLREGEVILDVSTEFFKGFKTHVDDIQYLLEGASSAVLVGENVVNKAIEAGYIHVDAVLKVSNIPYAYLVKV